MIINKEDMQVQDDNGMNRSDFFPSKKEELREKIGAIFFVSLLVILLFFLVLFFIAKAQFDDTPLVEKAVIKRELSTVIKGDPELKTVKHVYEKRQLIKPTLNSKLDRNDYYTENTPLSTILIDLKVDFLSQDNPHKDDTLYYSRLEYIIQENEYHNPFESLEEHQRRYFEDLKSQIGDGYDNVQDDVLQIAKELDQKNQLVSHYLQKSNTSFNISIWALIATCCLSLFQIIQGIRSSKKIKALFDNIRTGQSIETNNK